MKKLSLLMALSVVAAASQAVVITQWNFNDSTNNASIGNGVITLVGGIGQAYVSGSGSTDPTQPGLSLNTLSYPAQNTASGTAGAAFSTSTVGYQNIVVSFDTRHSNTASRYFDFQYTLDGTNYTTFTTMDEAGTTAFASRSVNLSSIAGANNNANFGVRLVSVFSPAGGYEVTAGTGVYSPNGTKRYDMFTFSGDAVPEPATMAVLGLGVAAVLRRRAKKA